MSSSGPLKDTRFVDHISLIGQNLMNIVKCLEFLTVPLLGNELDTVWWSECVSPYAGRPAWLKEDRSVSPLPDPRLRRWLAQIPWKICTEPKGDAR